MSTSAVSHVGARGWTLPSVFVATAVAMAFADSSIVVLALPELYGHFHTTIQGVAWVVTAYNVAVAATALVLVAVVRRLRAATALTAGLLVFLAASIACAAAWSLGFLIAMRAVQGVGAALLLTGGLPALVELAGSAAAGARRWTTAGAIGIAVGPALGGVLTQAFDWRAIFVAQAPVAGLALLAVARREPAAVLEERGPAPGGRILAANLCLALLFGALVGALFLAVLLVISVWDYSPIAGAGLVSALPIATVAARPLGRRLPPLTAVWGGAGVLAGGLVGLALLPSAKAWLAVWALALCGAGLGLALPVLSNASLDLGRGLARSGTLSVGFRHIGLVLALASIAPLLASEVPSAGDRALHKATAVLLDAPVGLDKKVPVALDLRSAFAQAQAGQTPNLAQPFDAHGARDDPQLAAARDKLIGTVEATITRASRPAFLLSAGFALLAMLAALLLRRRLAL